VHQKFVRFLLWKICLQWCCILVQHMVNDNVIFCQNLIIIYSLIYNKKYIKMPFIHTMTGI